MDGSSAPNGTYLCYGDYVLLETPVAEGGITGGLLGLEEIEASTSRLSVIPTREFLSTSSMSDKRTKLRRKQMQHKDESISIFTKKRYLGISPIYIEENKDRTNMSLPAECFNANIFQVAHSVGFEAPGEPVHYGSQIKLVLVSTQEFARASNDSDMIEFVSKLNFEHNSSKEFNFKVKPRYNVRGEGELVFFRDLIVLSDYSGRELYTAGSNQVKLTINSTQNSGFRIVQYIPFPIIAEKVLKGGDVLQIYHNVDKCFLNGKYSSSVTNNSSSVRVNALQQDKITIETCSTLWQVETVLNQNVPKDWKLQGPLYHGAPFLLRHFLTGKYLTVLNNSSDNDLVLVDEPTEFSYFEFRLNVNIASPAINDIFSGNKIPAMSDVRITHRATGKCVIIVQENRNVGCRFSLASSNYDKDVFKIHSTQSHVLEVILYGKKIMSGIGFLLKMLEAPHLTRIETNGLFAKLTLLLKSLYIDGGFLDGEEKIGFTAANDLGMVQVLFKLIDKAFEKLGQRGKRTKFISANDGEKLPFQQVWEAEKEEMAKEAYFILSLLLKRNTDSVFEVIKCGGVSKMIEHLTKLNDSKDWSPPLLELIDAVNAESAEIGGVVDVMSTNDIEMLLDSVYQQLLHDEVPGGYAYLLLSRLCKADSSIVSSSERVNRKMQMVIAHHLLGSPYEDDCWPRYSVFMYRTAIAKPEPLGLSQKSDRDRTGKFYITTSIFGQVRPHHDPDDPEEIPVAPPAIAKDYFEADWMKAMKIRFEVFDSFAKQKPLSIPEVEAIEHRVPDYSKYEPIINQTFELTPWKELHEMDKTEMDFYCATLELLAALCAGRNLWTQKLVRRVLPIDHILYVLDRIQTHRYSKMHHIGDTTYPHLLPIKTAMLNVLYYCYVDSAYLPVIPTSGKGTFLDLDRQNITAPSNWNDIFLQECSMKLFGWLSQEDYHLTEIYDDMNVEELQIIMKGFRKVDLLKEVHRNLFEEAKTFLAKKDADQARKSIRSLHRLIKEEVADKNIRSLEQRAVLMRLVKRFINEEALPIWLHDIKAPLLAYSKPKDNNVFHNNQVSMYISRIEFDLDLLDVDRIQGMKRNIGFLESMFVLVRSLMLRRFFDPEYNANPNLRPEDMFCLDAADSEKYNPEYFYKEYESPYFQMMDIVTVDDKHLQVLTCRENIPRVFTNSTIEVNSGGLKSPLRASRYAMMRMSSQRRLLYNAITNGENSPNSKTKTTGTREFSGDIQVIRNVMECMLNILRVGPELNLDESCSELLEDDKYVDDYYRRQFGYDQDDHDLTSGVMNINLLCCKVLSVTLDLLHAVTLEELRLIFLPLFDQVIQMKINPADTKTLSGRSTSASANSSYRKPPSPIRSREGHSDSDVHAYDEHDEDAPVHLIATLFMAKKRKMTLSDEESKHFRNRTWGELYMRVARNPDMIWNITDLFREDTFQSLLFVIYYNDPQLRAEILNLMYRVNARRAELSEYLMHVLQIEYVESSNMMMYLNKRRFELNQSLSKFDRFYFPVDKTNAVSANNDENDSIHNEPQEVLDIYLYHLKKVLFYYSEKHEELGILNFTCLERFEGTDAIEEDADEEAAPETNQDESVAGLTSDPSIISPRTPKVLGSVGSKQRMSLTNIAEQIKAQSDRNKRKPIFNQRDSGFTESVNLISNKFHQNLLVEFGFHTIAIDYMNRNSQSLLTEEVNQLVQDITLQNMLQPTNSSDGADGSAMNIPASLANVNMSTLNIKDDDKKKKKNPYIEVYRQLIHFFQMLLRENAEIASKIITREFLSTLVAIRNIVSESIDLLVVIIKLDPKLVYLISDVEFLELMSDVKAVIMYPPGHSQYTQAKKITKHIRKTVKLLQQVVLCDIKASPYRLHHFVSIMTTPLSLHENLLHRVFRMGLEFDVVDHKPYAMGVNFNIPFTCHKYQIETGRSTFSRLPRDVLSDKPVDEIYYQKLKLALQHWKCLSLDCAFHAHLELVGMISLFSKHSTSLSKQIRSLFPSVVTILQMLMIDKYEIKVPYLKLLEGCWFVRSSDQDSIQYTQELMDRKAKPYLRALIYSFAQDLRFYLHTVRDPTMDKNTVRKNKQLGLFPIHFKLLEKYIHECIVPFIQSLIKSNLYDSVDEIKDDEEITGLMQSQKRKQTPTSAPLPAIPSSTSTDLTAAVGGRRGSLMKDLLAGVAASSEDGNLAAQLSDKLKHRLSLSGTAGPTALASPTANNAEESSAPQLFQDSVRFATISVVDLIAQVVDSNQALLLRSKKDTAALRLLFVKMADIPNVRYPSLRKAVGVIDNYSQHSSNKPANISLPVISKRVKTLLPDELTKLRQNCLQEFIPEVDRFATTNGYIGLDHLVKTPCAQRVYTHGQEHVIQPNIGSDISLIAAAIGSSKYDIITNPLNCESFRYTQKEISKIIVTYSQLKYDARFQQIVIDIENIPNNQENDFMVMYHPYQKRAKEMAGRGLGDYYLTPSNTLIDEDNIYNNTINFISSLADDRPSGHVRFKTYFSEAQFNRWSKRQGMVLELIFQHILYCLQSFQQGTGLEKVSYSHDATIKCNLYWSMIFTTGLLRSRVNDLYDLYSDQTETQLAQLNIENQRLELIQEVFEEIGAVEVVVKQLSVSFKDVRKILSEKGVRLLHQMAIDMGTALTENGNHKIQNSVINNVDREYQLAQVMGREMHFVSVVRSLFQTYSQKLSSMENIDGNTTAEIVRLLRFLSLLCEGHNQKAQLYLGHHKVVSEVATFVSDMSKILSNEMNKSFFTEEEFPMKLHPKVLGIKRPLIRWISPFPACVSHNDDSEGNNSAENTVSDGRNVAASDGPRRGSIAMLGLDKLLPPQIRPPPLETSHPKKHRMKFTFLNVEKMALLVEVITAALEALSEFCQGPIGEIQLIITRAGTTKEFGTFFQFFGAFHLAQKVIYSNNINKVPSRLFKQNVQSQVTHEAVLNLPSHGSHWYGNDPMSMMMIMRSLMSHSTSNSKHSKAFQLINQLENPLLAANNIKALFQGTEEGIDEEIAAKYSSIQSNNMDISQFGEWIGEKNIFVEYRRVRHKISESFDGNYYSRIMKFEEKLVGLESSCVKLAASLMEGLVSDVEIPQIVTQNIGPENLIANMCNYWDRFLKYDINFSDVSTQDCFERKLAYSYYALVMRICDLNCDNGELSGAIDSWLSQSKIQVQEHIARIEVRGPDETTPVVAYFPVPSLIKQYWDRGDIVELRDDILYPTQMGKRDSAEEKVKSFVRDARELITTLRHLESLDEIIGTKSVFLYLIVGIAHNINRWSNITFLITIALNIMLIISIKTTNSGYEIGGQEYRDIIIPMAIAHLCSTCLTVFSFSIMYAWLYLKMGWRENPTNEFSFRGKQLSRAVFLLNRIGVFGYNRAELVGNNITIRVWTVTASIKYIFERYACLYYIALLIFSILGNTTSYLFFACCLMEVLRLSKLMQYVTKAFTANIDQVVATLMLAAVIMYLFTTLAFSDKDLHNKYHFEGFGENGCYSLESCFRLHIDYGMLQSVNWKYDGNIGTAQGELFNFAFTFIIQIVIPGLISGIIIDTFSEMRGNKQVVEEDILNTCFICNIDREDFETANVEFGEHIKNDHNMWNYVWFMVYLDEKDHTEFDGIEQFCYEIISRKDCSTRWLPVKMARALSQMRDKYDLFTIYNKITSLQNTLEKMNDDIKSDLVQQEKNLKEALKSLNVGDGGRRGGRRGGFRN